MDGIFRSAPVFNGGTLVAACDNKLIVGVDPDSGQLKWTSPTPAPVFGQPVVVGKYVVCALSDNTLIAINPADGTQVWTAPYNIYEGIQGSLGVYQNNVLICTNQTKVISFNVNTKKMDWTKPFTQLPASPTPIVVDDRVYLTSGPYLVALNADTGAGVWQVDTRMDLAFAPACSGSGIMVVSSDGHVLMYDVNRKLLTKKPIELGSSPIARPTVVGKKFIIPTSNGGVVLLDPASGSKLWNYVIHPIEDTKSAKSTTNSGSGKGGFGGFGGGQGAPSGPGGPGGPGGSSTTDDKVYYIQASGSAVLAGQTLLIPAKDGSLLAFDKDLGVDLTPPTVKMLFPNPGEQVSGLPPLILLFRVEDDNSGINKDSLKITVNGQDLEYSFTKEGLVLVRFSMLGKNKSLADGRRTFTVTVSDWLGNEGKTEFALIIDNLLPKIVLPGQDNNGPGGKNGGFGGGGGGGLGSGD